MSQRKEERERPQGPCSRSPSLSPAYSPESPETCLQACPPILGLWARARGGAGRGRYAADACPSRCSVRGSVGLSPASTPLVPSTLRNRAVPAAILQGREVRDYGRHGLAPGCATAPREGVLQERAGPGVGPRVGTHVRSQGGPLVGLGPSVPHSEMPVVTLLQGAEVCPHSSSAAWEAQGPEEGRGLPGQMQ